jgi:hypothetical protein
MKRLWPSLLFIVLSLLLSMFLVEGSVSGQSPQPGR